jgi:L-seryl-tRNA(Ser) seleniumtransferase
LKMIMTPPEAIADRADALAAALVAHGVRASVAASHSTTGGGSAPQSAIPTSVVVMTHPRLSAEQLQEHLRHHSTPVIARIVDDRVVIDLRTVDPEDDGVIASAIPSGSN